MVKFVVGIPSPELLAQLEADENASQCIFDEDEILCLLAALGPFLQTYQAAIEINEGEKIPFDRNSINLMSAVTKLYKVVRMADE